MPLTDYVDFAVNRLKERGFRITRGRRLVLELLQTRYGSACPSLHRCRFLGGLFQRFRSSGAKGLDLTLVVAPALDGGELTGADVVRADRHR